MNAFIFVWRIGFLFYHNVRMRIPKIFVIKRNVANDTKSIGNDVEYIIQIYRIVHDMEYFLSIALMAMEVVSTPNEELEEENYIRDVADRPILRAALNAKADIL